MSNDFQDTLKALGKQAKQAAQVRAEAEAQARKQAAAEVDFAKEMSGVVPLKNTNRYTPPRDTAPIRQATDKYRRLCNWILFKESRQAKHCITR